MFKHKQKPQHDSHKNNTPLTNPHHYKLHFTNQLLKKMKINKLRIMNLQP
jgi:hypothetical protein